MSRNVSVVSKVAKVFPLIGVFPQFLRAPNKLAVKLMRSSNEVVPLPFGPVTLYMVHHPDHLRHVLLDNRANYWKGPMAKRGELLVGNGLVLSEGAHWRRQRKLMQQHFKPRHLSNFVPSLAHVVTERIRHWKESSEPLDMLSEMSRITMTALLKWLFSYDIDESMITRFDRLFTILSDHLEVRGPTWFLPEWFPLPGRPAALKASAEVRSIIGDIISARRRSGKHCDDLLDMFLSVQDEAGQGMTQEQIIDEIQTLIFAGYDSTASSLTWTWQLLASHPEAALRAQQEAQCMLPETGVPTLEHLGRLEYLERVFKESLRLHPPFAFLPRTAHQADVIGQQRIKPGATLIYSVYAVHRNPDFWEHPDAFYPDHFLSKHVSARHRFAFIPFGAGPRVCIGLHMAMLEAKTVLALALRDYDIVRAHGQPQMMGRLGTARPKEPIRIELRARVRQVSSVRLPPSHRERIVEPPPSYRNVVPPSYRIIEHDVVPPSARKAATPPSVRSAEMPASYRIIEHAVVPASVRSAEVPASVRSAGPASLRVGAPPSSLGARNARPGSVPNRRSSIPRSERSGGCPFHPQAVQRSPSIPPPSIGA